MSVHDHMIDLARTELLGASKEGIKQAIWQAYREWFDLSNAWQEQIDFTIQPNVQTYNLVSAEMPPGRILRLVDVYDSNLIPWPASMSNLNLANLPGVGNSSPATPTGKAPPIGTIYLHSMPSNTQPAYAIVSKTCQLPQDGDRGLPEVPEWFVLRWMEKIYEGVVGRMMNQPDKPYSNPKQADYHLRKFQMEAANARVAALRGNTYGRQAWSYPQNWRTSGQRGGVSVGNDNTF